MRYLFFSLILLFLTSCYHQKDLSASGSMVKVYETDEQSVFVLVGAGMIKIYRRNGVTIVDESNLGIYYSDELSKFSVGYAGETTTIIDGNVNSLIEIRGWLDKSVKVEMMKNE